MESNKINETLPEQEPEETPPEAIEAFKKEMEKQGLNVEPAQRAENYTEERPWGSFTVLDSGQGYKVKRISVNPNQRLSLQYHHHRKEYWTVVKGNATVLVHHQKSQDYFKDTLKSGKSVFIPKGAKHRLSNHTKEMVEIIEVQCGDYLEEDDIVRLDDDYERDLEI